MENKGNKSENNPSILSHLEPQDEKRRVVLSALAMAIGTFSSRVLGLVRDMAFAALFSRTVTDAWTAAFRLPNLFRRLLGEGSLSVSFIPIFVDAKMRDEKDSTQEAQNLVNGVYTVLLATLSVLTILGIIYSDTILRHVILDPAYVSDVDKMALTVRMAKIMFGFIFLMSQFAFFMGILNALGQFSLPALAPVFFNITMIISTVLPKNWFDYEGDMLAWGVLFGGFFQMVVLVPALRARGYFPSLSFQRLSADVKKVFKNMAPGILGTGLLQITTVINLRFSSSLGEGPISYIYFADRLLELPLSLVAVSLGTALLPTLSKMWAAGDKEKALETSNYYLRLNLFVAIPAAIGLFVLSKSIVQTLFMRGKFNETDVNQTALVVSVYALTLIVASSVRVLVPMYYAIKNTWWPTVASGLGLLIHLLLAPWLMQHFHLMGLVSSSFISATINLILLFVGVSIFMGQYPWMRLVKSISLFCGAGLGMAVVAYYSDFYLSLLFGQSEIERILKLGISVSLSAIVYAALSYLFKIEEFMVTFDTLKKKFNKKLRRV